MHADLENAILNNLEYDLINHANPLPPPLPKRKAKTPLGVKIVAGFGLSLLGMVAFAVVTAAIVPHQPIGASDSKYTAVITKPVKLAKLPTKCHGYSGSDGHWHLNVDSWSYDEMDEAASIAKQLNAANAGNPNYHESSGSVAAILDQFQCASGRFNVAPPKGN